MTTSKKPRKHAELIKQWANDDSLVAQIRTDYHDDNSWVNCDTLVDEPQWCPNRRYRLIEGKPSAMDLLRKELQEIKAKLGVAEKLLGKQK